MTIGIKDLDKIARKIFVEGEHEVLLPSGTVLEMIKEIKRWRQDNDPAYPFTPSASAREG
jgi:hypothetical protein